MISLIIPYHNIPSTFHSNIAKTKSWPLAALLQLRKLRHLAASSAGSRGAREVHWKRHQKDVVNML